MLLFLLVACAPERPGVYDVTYGAPAGTCATMPTVTPGTLRLEPSEEGVVVRPFDELCPRVGEGFACELEALDSRFAWPGLDAAWVVDVDLDGAWRRPAQAGGRVTWSVTCAGADCAAVADLAPAPCEAAWDWTGTFRPNGLKHYCDEAPAAAPFELWPLGEAPWDPARIEAPDMIPVVTADDLPVRWTPLLVDRLVDQEAALHLATPELTDTELRLEGYWQSADAPAWDVDADTCDLPTPPRWVALDTTLEHVGTFGRAPGFAPESALGAWEIDAGALLANGHADVGGLATFLSGLRLEVLDAADGEAEVRLVTPTFTGDGECVLLHDRAALSATGELTWAKDRIEAAAEPAPLVLHGPRVRLGFDGTDDAAGGEVSAIVDVRATVGRELDLCDLGATFGARCEACPDDGEPYCIPLAGYAWTATRSTAEVGADLPMCGVDFTDTGVVPDVEIDCEPSGGLCAAAWVVLLAPLVRRRRADRADRAS